MFNFGSNPVKQYRHIQAMVNGQPQTLVTQDVIDYIEEKTSIQKPTIERMLRKRIDEKKKISLSDAGIALIVFEQMLEDKIRDIRRHARDLEDAQSRYYSSVESHNEIVDYINNLRDLIAAE